MRLRPEKAELYGCAGFIKWANKKGLGTKFDEWEGWWTCWKAGYCSAKGILPT
jgi:hypothetical protein